MRIYLVTNIKRKFDIHGDIGEALSCAAVGKHSEIFDRREMFHTITFFL